jgi:23S rRNA-/tRNA-specific pseudouridylate synthase
MTEFELINNKEGMALLSAIPKTGRTHQIRVHLKELGFPILGDKMYGGKPYDRLCLHCYSLTILGINRKKMLFKALPDAGFPFGVGDIE